MQEFMSLETLPNMEGTTSSESVDQLSGNAITVEDLREDIVVEVSDTEKQRIIDNFPNEKNNYLIVPRVIEE
jgi:Asp-tRNA(Asn)/Glu-tRNA(Gln) amidotransferase C subunit